MHGNKYRNQSNLSNHIWARNSVSGIRRKKQRCRLFLYQRLFRRLVEKAGCGIYQAAPDGKSRTEALLSKDRRILDIAVELGFSSHEHFSRTFKSTFGMTPEESRSHPKTLNRMTKPELLLHYTLIDEGVPLITDGIVLEINRRQVKEPIRFIGMEKTMPVSVASRFGDGVRN